MELWKFLLIIGILLVIIYFYRKRKENMGEERNNFSQMNNDLFRQIPQYPIDIEVQQYKNNFNVAINNILMNISKLANQDMTYPVIFNSSLKPVEKIDMTNNPKEINSLISYLERIFNSINSNYQIKNIKVKKLIKHLTDQQLKYDMLLSGNINEKNIDIYMEVIISRFISGETKPSFSVYLKSLNLANYDHLQYLSGMEVKMSQEQIKLSKNKILDNKKNENQLEVQGLTNNFDPKYPEYSLYEMFVPSNGINKYSDCNPDVVHTEDILNIFQ
jgi:hypothetical protein